MRCINCGIAMTKLRSHALSSLSEHEQNRLTRWVANGQTQPSTSNYVCRGCWMKAKHGEAAHGSSRGSKETAVNNKLPVKLEVDSPPEPPCQNDPHQRNDPAGQNEPPCPNELPCQNDPHHQNELPCQNEPPPRQTRLVNELPLPNYKKASTASVNCIFQQCTNSRLHLVPVYIKKQLLQKHNFYVPPSCRICESHLSSNQWHLLPQMADTNSIFNVKEIEDLFDIIRAKANLLDFENVIDMPNHICQYWTELTVLQFLNLFERLPNLNVEQPKRALAIYLIKRRSGDSYGRLADLFNIPRLTLKLIVGKVRLCLNDVNDSTVTELLKLNVHRAYYKTEP